MRHSTTQTAARAILALGLAAFPGRCTAPDPCPPLFAQQFRVETGGGLGLIGSKVFVREPPVSLDSVLAMINFDMVGRLKKGELTIDQGANGQGLVKVLDTLAILEGIRPVFWTSLAGRSDHGPFDEVMVPAFALFTGFHADYHTANDIPARVDALGSMKIVDLIERLVRSTGAPVGDAR